MGGRILIADPLATNRMVLSARLLNARYRVHAVAGAEEVLASLREDPPALMILDESLTAPDGRDLCRNLKEASAAAVIPLIVLTRPDDAEAGIRALHAGADEFLVKPIDEIALLARVRSLLRARETHMALNRRRVTVEELGFAEPPAAFAPPGRIVFVGSSRGEASAWREAVSGLIRDPVTLTDADGALGMPEGADAADLFLVAADLDRPGDGLRLLSDLRSRAETRHAAIIVLHRRAENDTAATALDLGANDVVAEGFLPAELALRIRTQLRRKQDADRLRASVEDGLRLAVTDELTGLFNRRYALTHLGRIAEGAARTGRPYTAILCDIDRFKDVNDGFGHGVGDEVLRGVAARLRDRVRDVDLVARIGGEEFLAALPDIAGEDARAAADRLRLCISERPFLMPGLPPLRITVSLGVAVADPGLSPPPTLSDLLDRADAALYDAKEAGRNVVAVAGPGAQRSRRTDWSRRSA